MLPSEPFTLDCYHQCTCLMTGAISYSPLYLYSTLQSAWLKKNLNVCRMNKRVAEMPNWIKPHKHFHANFCQSLSGECSFIFFWLLASWPDCLSLSLYTHTLQAGHLELILKYTRESKPPSQASFSSFLLSPGGYCKGRKQGLEVGDSEQWERA